jgi:predicted secreted hydrolase
VTGSAWFDHQWGDMGKVFEQSWDWFGIQLDDDREIMAFRMRVGGEEKLRGGSLSTAAGQSIRLKPDEIAITPQGTWESPHSGCRYPRQWLLRIKDQDLLLTPVIEDQELWSSLPRYWEGAAEVGGSATGRAFIELNNYCW